MQETLEYTETSVIKKEESPFLGVRAVEEAEQQSRHPAHLQPGRCGPGQEEAPL